MPHVCILQLQAARRLMGTHLLCPDLEMDLVPTDLSTASHHTYAAAKPAVCLSVQQGRSHLEVRLIVRATLLVLWLRANQWHWQHRRQQPTVKRIYGP